MLTKIFVSSRKGAWQIPLKFLPILLLCHIRLLVFQEIPTRILLFGTDLIFGSLEYLLIVLTPKV